MSTPLSFCDISARYGQMPAPQKSVEEQTGWNPNQLFKDYLMKLQRLREQEEEHAREDALMAMIDAMNASEEDKASGKTEQTLAESLANAGKAITEQAEEIMEDGTKRVGWVDPTQTLTVQALLSCLGDRFNFEQVDQVEENNREDQEDNEKRLEVTEAQNPSETSDPTQIGKEV